MDKNTIKLTYGLGIILGVCLSLVVLIFAYKNGVFHLEDNTRVLSEQNRKLEKNVFTFVITSIVFSMSVLVSSFTSFLYKSS